MSGSNLTCTSLGLLLTRGLLCPWAGHSLCLCAFVCPHMCVLISVPHSQFSGSACSGPSSCIRFPLCTCVHAWGPTAIVDYKGFIISTVSLCPKWFVCARMWKCPQLAKLMRVCVCLWAYAWSVSSSRRLGESKTWISLKGIEPVERSAAKFSD